MKWDCEMQLLFHTYFASKKRANLLCKSKIIERKIFLFPHCLSTSEQGYEPIKMLSMSPAAAWILSFKASKIIFSLLLHLRQHISLSIPIQRPQHSEKNWSDCRNMSLSTCIKRARGVEYSECYPFSSSDLILIVTKGSWGGGT